MGNNTKSGGSVQAKSGWKFRHVLVTVLLVSVVIVFLGAVAFLALQISGKNSLYGKADAQEMRTALSEMTVSLGGTLEEEEEEEDWQVGDFRYKGVHYRYNEDIMTFLFLGIDDMDEVKVVADGVEGGQSDAIFLLVMNPHNKQITVIAVNRNTMTDIDVYDKLGNYLGRAKAQLALQHGYGDAAGVSCERTKETVSNLFRGLPIHGYCAINMGAIPLLNDAVGGIELQALETMDFKDFSIEEGETIHLKGMDAYYYLHNRDVNTFNSAGGRLARQQQYLMLYAEAAIQAIKADITFPVTLYNTLSKYMVTDVSLNEVSYLATQMLDYQFNMENMHSLRGSTVMGEKFEEFYVDETALYELIVEVFYEEVK